MSEDVSGIKMLGRRVTVIVFALMVALLGANELQRRNKVKNGDVAASRLTPLLRGEVDFMKPELKEQVEGRAALKREKTGGEEKSTKETLRSWADQLLR